MGEWCVFCGADLPEGGLVCPDCRPRVADLPEDVRQIIEECEKEEKARETIRAAMTHLRLTLADIMESLASLLRQFGKKGKS